MKSNNGTWRFKRSLAAVAVSAILGLPGAVYAADTSNILGSVKGLNSSQSYSVKVKDPKTGFSREVSLDNAGNFRVSQLPIGEYQIEVTANGKVVAQDKVRLSLGSNSVASFALNRPNDGTEVIEVTGARIRAVDVTSVDSGLVVGEMEFDKMPVARNITAVSLLAPGVVLGDSKFGASGGIGFASFGGSSISENACYINGLEVTNTRQGLGCGSVPFEFYKEFQVKTGGYSAMYGRSTGGVLNAVTKSGSNEWEFAFTANSQPSSLRAEGKKSYGTGSRLGQVFRDTTDDEFSESDLTLSASGPLIEDKLFIYAIVNPRDRKSEWSDTSGRVPYDADNRWRTLESSGSDNLFWGSKIDWDIVEGHRLSFFAYSDRTDSQETRYARNPNTGIIGAKQGDFVNERGGEAASLSYVGSITDDFTVNLMYGKIKTQYGTTPTVTDCPFVTDGRQVAKPIVGCGAGGTLGDDYDDNKQTRADFEWAAGDLYGSHLLKFGYDKQDRQSRKTTAPVGGHSFTYSTKLAGDTIQGNNGQLWANTTGKPVDLVEDRIFVGGGSFGSELTAWYIEDQYQPTEQLTLNIGVRQDHFINTGATGVDFVDLKTDVAPRLGFSYDPTGSGESKIFGTWGRYYLPVPNNTNYRAASGVDDTTTYYYFTGFDPKTGAPTGATPVNGTVGNSQVVNSTSTAMPSVALFQAQEAEPFYKEEWVLGYETQLTDDYSASVRGTYRFVGAALDDFCGPVANQHFCTLVNPGKPGSWYSDADDDNVPDAGSLKTYTAADMALPEADNDYVSLQSQLAYRNEALRWDFIYTWSRSTGNFEGAVKSDINQADAGITQDFDFPALMDGADGYQANDRRHVFKFFGSYDVTDKLTLGMNSTLSSGRPLSMFGQGYPSSDPKLYGSYGDTFYLVTGCTDTNGNGKCDPAERIFSKTPRGSAGRTPWNFNVDVSATYDFTVSGVDLRASVNVYNILNIQEITSSNEHYEARRSAGTFNPWYNAAYTWQTPRYVRVGIEGRF
ncbi:TonB-dependent receptor [Rheinheimera tilapiae]|jgi:hypothetical protein|uniref:TonB-dependent receptor plug domain-containing protein n=1 Tax=Rheinheimera tilapiae TaxID=875043 RepID=A0ABV6BLT7_9GAMM